MKRPFRGLRRRPPASRYDAVIIGAGIGGLFTANLLARAGLKVLLTEQHYMVGGYCSTFKRKRYTFDAATHFYPLLGNPETLTGKLLGELGIETGWVKMDPVDTFHFPDGSRFEVPADFESYSAMLHHQFPHQSEALHRFFAEVKEAYLKGLLCYFRRRDCELLGRYRWLTVREVLDRHFTDRKLKLLLTADCPHWGSPPSRTSFVFDSMLRLSYFLGNYYPRGGSQAFADELALRFEELGGDILTSSRVNRIRVRGGRAIGVEVETLRGALTGRRLIDAETVISNADLKLTLEHLLQPRWVDPQQLAALGQRRESYPCFLVHLGLRGVDDADLERAQGYYWREWDADEVGRSSLTCKIFSPTLYEPAMAPDGGQIVILQKVLEMEPGAVETWSAERWAAHKARLERFMVAQLERAIPGIGRKIVVQTSASAKTSWRFTRNSGGAMLGWEMSPDQLGADRPDIEGPVKNLYHVGHWARPGGGITPVIVSAMHVAEAVSGSATTTVSSLPSTRPVQSAASR